MKIFWLSLAFIAALVVFILKSTYRPEWGSWQVIQAVLYVFGAWGLLVFFKFMRGVLSRVFIHMVIDNYRENMKIKPEKVRQEFMNYITEGAVENAVVIWHAAKLENFELMPGLTRLNHLIISMKMDDRHKEFLKAL